LFGPAGNDGEGVMETTKEDREAVEDLERWDNEFKILAISKAIESDQKKAIENQMQFKGDKFESYITPMLNREILNLIDEDEERGGKYGSTMNGMSKKVRVPQKSLETIMTEYNKKILNEILYQRVSKKMNNKEGVQQHRMDLDYTTKTVSTDTISNFKNLQHTIQTNPRIIQYDDLYQKLTAERNVPEKVFDLEEDRKKILEAENDYEAIEVSLKAQYEAIIGEIQRKKESLNDLRLIVHRNNDETKELEEEIEEILKKYEALESQYSQQKEQNKNYNRLNPRNKRNGLKDSNRQAAHVEEYSKVHKQMEEKKDQVREIKDRIEELEGETQKSTQKLNSLEREIKDLKFKKNQLRLQLKQLYLKIFKNEEHIFKNESSFITIIKNMWRINEEIVVDMFPAFVEKDEMNYLIENARLEYELEQLENLTRNDGLNNYNQQNDVYQQNDDMYGRALRSQQSVRLPLSEQLVDVRKRLQNLKKGIVKMKRPVFVKDGNSRSRVIQWEELSLETDDFNEQHMDDHRIQEKINRAVTTIKAKLAELKEKEISRIFNLYINKEIEEKTLKNLNKVLLSLFGRQDAEKIYIRFVRLKQAHDFKISQNKTFVFSSTKQASSMVNDKSKNSFALLLAYASNFRPDKSRNNQYAQEQQAGNEKKKEDQKVFTDQIKEFQQADNLAVNPKYNFNYNYFNDLPEDDPQALFYLQNRPHTNQGVKSTLRDNKNPMARTAGSFYNSNSKVTFKEPLRSTSEVEQINPAFFPNFGRNELRSAK